MDKVISSAQYRHAYNGVVRWLYKNGVTKQFDQNEVIQEWGWVTKRVDNLLVSELCIEIQKDFPAFSTWFTNRIEMVFEPDFVRHPQNSVGPVTHFMQNKEPYLVCKMVKFTDQLEADDFAAKQVNYIIARVPGFNIFFIEDHFDKPVDRIIRDDEKEKTIADLCTWYYEFFLKRNKRLTKLFTIKN